MSTYQHGRRLPQYRRKTWPWATLGVLLVIVLAAAYPIASYTHHGHYLTKVIDKDRTTKYKGGSDMRVYTEAGNFKVDDAFFMGNFHSSDTYASIKPGYTYEIETIGFRVPFLSQFPNIVKIDGEFPPKK